MNEIKPETTTTRTPAQDAAYQKLLLARVFYHESEEELDEDYDTTEEREKWRYMINLNDAWYWACADCERVAVEDLPEVWRMFMGYGWHGVGYWVMKQRNMTWEQIEFRDVRRFMQFIEHEEGIRASSEKPSAYAYSRATYTISDLTAPSPITNGGGADNG